MIETPTEIIAHHASQAAASSFTAWRKKSRKPLTEAAALRIAKTLGEINAAGGDASDALGMAEEHGWQTIKADWYFKLSPPKSVAPNMTPQDGRMEGCLLDGVEKDFIAPDSPLLGAKNLYVTPRIGSHTAEARVRVGWYVAHRMHDALAASSSSDASISSPMPLDMPGSGLTNSQWGDSSVHSSPPAG